MAAPPYCTREQVKHALDIAETARNNTQIDRAINASARTIEDGQLRRRFYPAVDTRSFDWPNDSFARPWRLWLDGNDLISVTTLMTGSVTLTEGTDFVLRRSDDRDEPPYTHIEILLDSTASFGQGSTHQLDIAITGLWGHSDSQVPAGALAAALNDTTGTDMDVTDGSLVGVGSLLSSDTERLLVTGRQMLDTGDTLQSDLDAAVNDQQVQVTDGTDFHVDELLLVDAEKMRIDDIAANTLIVTRAHDGSTLAAHTTGASIFASRRLTVERGAVGTTAATHTDGTAITRWQPPPLIESLNLAEAIAQLEQEKSAYGRTVGTGDNQREARGAGLEAIRRQAYQAHGRKIRTRAI